MADEEGSAKAQKSVEPVVNQKVPKIRLKLKIIKRVEGGKEEPEGADLKSADTVVNESELIRSNESVNSARPVASETPETSHCHCGTFKYRPFKLFPLLPPASRYRVLVPRPYTDYTRNPALPLNYLWAASPHPVEGIYTDDSDLVCVAVREGWCRVDEIKGKELMIEVEVVDAFKPAGNAKSTPTTTTSVNPIIPRVYSAPHDGNHIRILSVTLNPVAVHLKRWRKHKRRSSSDPTVRGEGSRLLTPTFKAGSGV